MGGGGAGEWGLIVCGGVGGREDEVGADWRGDSVPVVAVVLRPAVVAVECEEAAWVNDAGALTGRSRVLSDRGSVRDGMGLGVGVKCARGAVAACTSGGFEGWIGDGGQLGRIVFEDRVGGMDVSVWQLMVAVGGEERAIGTVVGTS